MRRRIVDHTCSDVHRRAQDYATECETMYLERMTEGLSLGSVIEAVAKDVAEIAQEYGASAIRRAYDSYCDDLERELDELTGDKKDLEREVQKLTRDNADLRSEIAYLERKLANLEEIA